MRHTRRGLAVLVGTATGSLAGLLVDRLPQHPVESTIILSLLLGEIAIGLWVAARRTRRTPNDTL